MPCCFRILAITANQEARSPPAARSNATMSRFGPVGSTIALPAAPTSSGNRWEPPSLSRPQRSLRACEQSPSNPHTPPAARSALNVWVARREPALSSGETSAAPALRSPSFMRGFVMASGFRRQVRKMPLSTLRCRRRSSPAPPTAASRCITLRSSKQPAPPTARSGSCPARIMEVRRPSRMSPLKTASSPSTESTTKLYLSPVHRKPVRENRSQAVPRGRRVASKFA
jgi:hypothetical protein